MNKEKQYKRVEDLNTRSTNTLAKLGGIQQMLLHYQQHGSFLNVSGAGTLTNFELTKLSQYLSLTYENDLKKEKLKKPAPALSKLDIAYADSKPLLSVRAQHTLAQIAKNVTVTKTETLPFAIIKAYLSKDIVLINYRNVGKKTVDELTQFFDRLLNADKTIYKSVFGNESAPLTIKKDFSQSLTRISATEFDDIIIDKKSYDILKAITYYLLRAKSAIVYQYVLKMIYFNNERDLTLQEIADESGCTKERVRQAKIEIREIIIPRAFKTFTLMETYKPAGLIYQGNHSDILIYNSEYIQNTPFLKNLTANFNYIRDVTAVIFKRDYIALSAILSHLSYDYFTFECNEVEVYFKKSSFDEENLKTIFIWLDTKIIEYEKQDEEYHLDSLIKESFAVNKIAADKRIRDVFSDIIPQIKRDISNTPIIKRGLRQKKKDDIALIIENILTNQGKPLKTAVISDQLSRKGIVLKTYDLTKLLNDHKNLFFYFGHGLWCLNSWQDKTMMNGRLTDIIRRILLKSEDPVHLSEIVKKIGTYRKTTEKSIVNNITQTNPESFIFFNCMFLGLTEKRYDKKWKNIPEIGKHRFTITYLKRQFKNNFHRIPKHYEKLYGYPKIHSEYLLKAKGLL